MQLNVKLYKITWYSIICVALPGILLFYLHIHLTTTHLNPNRCGLFVGFWLGIFAIHKTWTSLVFWWRIDDKTGTLAYPVWCIVWVVQTQLFAENSNRGRKVSPEKLKSSHSRRFLLEKSKKSKNSKSRKIRKNQKIRKVENFLTFWLFAKSFAIFALCDYRREERLVQTRYASNPLAFLLNCHLGVYSIFRQTQLANKHTP